MLLLKRSQNQNLKRQHSAEQNYLKVFRRRMLAITFIIFLLLFIALFAVTQSHNAKSLWSIYDKNYTELNQQLCSAIFDEKTIDYVELSNIEKENGVIIYIIDAQIVLTNPFGENDQRIHLGNQAQQQHQELSISSEIQTELAGSSVQTQYFRLTSDQRYCVYYNTNGISSTEFYMICDITAYHTFLFRQAIRMALMIFAVYVVTCVIVVWLSHRMLQPAIQAQEVQTQFMSVAGHEMKSPVAIIQASAQMITRDPKHIHDYSDNILFETHKLSKLIEDLLTISRCDLNIQNLNLTNLDVEAFILELYERFWPLFSKENRELNILFGDESPPMLLADEDKLFQVMTILLSNILDHTAPGTGAEISMRLSTRKFSFLVVDHGPGIKDKTKIFERFYSTASSRETNHFGLGLCIAKALVEQQGGSISVEDTVGGGATFIITLPLPRSLQ